MSDAYVIETSDLRKTYDGPGVPGGIDALRGLSLQVPRGSIFGFLGKNGAGKTTTIKVLLGMAHATSGEARPTDIARRLGVSHPTAINTITRLKRRALATARPYRGVFLTEKGEALARRVRTRHRLVVGMLLALGIPSEVAEADAEGIEHHVSETTLKAFDRFLQSRKQM